MIDDVRGTLAAESGVAFALLFGSAANGSQHARSDLDLAIGLAPGVAFDHRRLGKLVSRLEAKAGCDVDLVVLDEAPPGLAYRIFRDGEILFEHDHAALAWAKASAIMRYLDFEPVERLCSSGVLRRAGDGR